MDHNGPPPKPVVNHKVSRLLDLAISIEEEARQRLRIAQSARAELEALAFCPEGEERLRELALGYKRRAIEELNEAEKLLRKLD